MSTGLVGLHACVADLHPDAIIHVHTHDSYIRDDMSHRCDLLAGAPATTVSRLQYGARVRARPLPAKMLDRKTPTAYVH